MALTFADVEAAAAAIHGAVVATPSIKSVTLSHITGAEIYLKLENLQYTASFKERGALNKLLSLTADESKKGVIAVSAGNHAQGVAFHARRLGIPATIVMPRPTPFSKVRQTEFHGAEIVLEGVSLSEAAVAANTIRQQRHLTFIPPYDDAKIIAGQGTIAIELLEAVPDLDVLVVPVGGGVLISGVALAAKSIKPAIEVVGIESELYPTLHAAMGGNSKVKSGPTIAEGIAVAEVGQIPLKLIRGRVDDVLLIAENQIEAALNMFLDIEKMIVEGAAAAPLAAVLANPDRFRGRRVGLIVSGGNIDARLLASIIMRGLVRDGRMIRVRVEIQDTPGVLARVAGIVGDAGGNIVEVYHQRLFSDVPVKLADLDLVVETRDARQAEEVMSALAEAGFTPRRLSDHASGE